MILDAYLLMADSQLVSAGTTNLTGSTSYIDTKSGKSDDYAGCWWTAFVETAVTSTAASNVTFVLQSDSTTAFTAAVTHLSSGAVAKASLTAGYKYQARIPIGLLRYVRSAYTVDTTAASAGAVSFFITKDIDVNAPMVA